jgi:hypothetical protein
MNGKDTIPTFEEVMGTQKVPSFKEVMDEEPIVPVEEEEDEESYFKRKLKSNIAFVGDIVETLGAATLRVPEQMGKGIAWGQEMKDALFGVRQKMYEGMGISEDTAKTVMSIEKAIYNMAAPMSGATAVSSELYKRLKNDTPMFEELEKEAKKLNEKSDRYDEDIVTYIKKGEIGKAVGSTLLYGAESLPLSLIAAFGGPAGLTGLGFVAAGEKYDSLREREDMTEAAKMINATFTGGFEALTEAYGTAKIGKLVTAAYKTGGKKVAEKVVKDAAEGWFKTMYKKIGLYTAPVQEGLEEFTNSWAEAVTDKVTGAEIEGEEQNFREVARDSFEAFFRGMGGGTYFTAMGLSGKGISNLSERLQKEKEVEIGKTEEDDSKAEQPVVREEPLGEEPGGAVPKPEEGAGEAEAGRVPQEQKEVEKEQPAEKPKEEEKPVGKVEEIESELASREEAVKSGAPYRVFGNTYETKEEFLKAIDELGSFDQQAIWGDDIYGKDVSLVEIAKIAEGKEATLEASPTKKASTKELKDRLEIEQEQPAAEKPKKEKEEWTLEEVQAERAKETKPAAKAERGPAESLLASFRGYTGYWDAPVEKRGKIEESRDEFVKMFEDEQAAYEKQIDPRADPKEIDRARRYYAKQIRNVKKLFSRDKAVAQERGDEIRREMMRDFLQEKRKELAQIHGDKVPAMLQAVNKAKTRAEIRNAFDYIQKVLDSKVAKDKLRELNENLDYINKMTRDPSHKLFHDKSSKIARYKDNVAATKETIAKLDRIGEHLYARPNPGSKTNIPMASTVDGIERTARENAIDEIEKLYENNDAPTAEQSDRALELWFTDMGNMTAEEVGEAAIRIKEIVSLGKTKIQEQRDAKRGDIKANKKELIEDLTGKVKETAPKVIGEGPKKKMTTMIGDLIVGNRNWSSMLDRFSRYEFRRKNEVIGVYDSKLNRQFDKGLTQPAELEVKTLKRTRTEDMVHSFINAFRPTIDSRFKEGGWKERTSLKAIAVRNEVELIDIPFRALTTKEKDPRDRVMKVTRDELSEMYQQMENPETHRSLADGGFLIQRTGEIVKVKRPVVERGEDGVLRKTGEYENTDLGNQVYEAMDAKSELGEKYRNEGLKELAESDFNTYEKWGDEVSPVYEEVFGPPMPRRKKYAPIFRDVQTKEGMTPEEMLDAQSAFAVGNNRHLYKMTRSTKPIVIMGSRRVMSSYMHKMSQFQGKATAVRELNTYWRDKDVQRAIKDEYGQNHIEWLNQFLDQFAGQKVPQKTIRWMDKLRRNIMVASLGIKPMIYVKQTTSLPAYSLFLPRGRLAEGVAEYIGVNTGIIKDRTILNHIKNNDYLKNRYDKFTGGNMDRDISEVQQRAKEIRNPGTIDWNKYRDMSMGLVKMGDRAPIMAGGYAVYKYHYKKNLSKGEAVASKIAADEFMHATKSAQQASDITDLSSYQRGDSWMRMATMYMTAPMSYHRIASGGLRRFEGGIRGGNPKMIKEGARQFFIAHVVLPVIFQAATNFFRFDTEEKRWDILRAALLGNINNLFALGDLIDHVADRFVGKPFDYQTFPAASIPKGFGNTAKEIQDIIEKIVDGDDITIDDILEVVDELEAPMSHAFGVPVPGPKNIYEGIRDVAQGETEGFWDSLARIMGMSENAIEAGREKEEGVRQKQTRQKPQQKEVRQKPN